MTHFILSKINQLSDSRSDIIARNQNTFAKRQREAEKKAKAERKRNRRNQQKQLSNTNIQPELDKVDPETPEGSE